jgi:hypothetical protein
MRALVFCLTAYIVALSAWAWTVRTPEPRPVFTPVNIQFCQDWQDMQASRCDVIPFRKEVAI